MLQGAAELSCRPSRFLRFYGTCALSGSTDRCPCLMRGSALKKIRAAPIRLARMLRAWIISCGCDAGYSIGRRLCQADIEPHIRSLDAPRAGGAELVLRDPHEKRSPGADQDGPLCGSGRAQSVAPERDRQFARQVDDHDDIGRQLAFTARCYCRDHCAWAAFDCCLSHSQAAWIKQWRVSLLPCLCRCPGSVVPSPLSYRVIRSSCRHSLPPVVTLVEPAVIDFPGENRGECRANAVDT